MNQISATSFGVVASDYSKSRAGFPSKLFDRLAHFGIGLPTQKILDIGTGTGTLARQFAARGCQVVGLDADERMLEQAKILAIQEGVDVEFIGSKAEDIPLSGGEFDVIAAGQCWHWFEHKAVLREVSRLLAPDGKLVIAHFDWIPLKDNVVEATEKLIMASNPAWHYEGGDGVHGHFLKDIVDAGFGDIETFSFEHPVIYSHDDWCARIRASAGISSLSEQGRAIFTDQLQAMLAEQYPTNPLRIHHRVFAIIAQKDS